ncbi:hypothetical protein Y1Q_0019326 [Alligator mississippiensis]|uniref:Uncharacterized protein n=1 Tax=Alligator mississippiensis TaxID=8496 RepID=A0A151MQT4_ALLMI|nr:hypothetical protein Y1Q_0019326 [Alligator mississippiensis]
MNVGKRRARDKMRELKRRQERVQSLIVEAGRGREVEDKLKEAKRKDKLKEVEEWFKDRDAENIFLVKVPWVAEWEEWNSYVTARVRKAKGEVERVKKKNEDCVEDQEEVLNTVADFYEDLYRKQKIDTEQKRRGLVDIKEKVEDERKDELEGN